MNTTPTTGRLNKDSAVYNIICPGEVEAFTAKVIFSLHVHGLLLR